MIAEDEIYRLLEEVMPWIRRILVNHYRFMEEEAEAFEDTLCVWFFRLARRTSSGSLGLLDLKQQIVFVACKYARAIQIAKFKGRGPQEESFTLTLARTPEEVATELMLRLLSQATS